MKKAGTRETVLLLAASALLLPVFAAVAEVGDQQTLTGTYVWNSGRPSTLKATFTATGDNRWDVAFHFKFRGRPEIFSGTATGNLATGKLEGRVRNQRGSGPRTFTFRGEFENGTFRGRHAEVYGKRESSTGTLTLKPRGRPGSDVL